MIRRSLSIIGLATIFSAKGFAHHSLDAFDITREESVRGTVLRFDWANPHTSVELEVPDGPSGSAVWRLEGMSASYLGRRNWNRRSLEPGDDVEVGYFPLKSGEPGGMVVRVVLADGTMKVMVNNTNRDRSDGANDE